MPSKNIVKEYVADSYYHVFNRGVAKQDIFRDKTDYVVFLNLLKRYLAKDVQKDPSGREYPNYRHYVDLNAFCLMPNHFHLLLFQKEEVKGMTLLLKALCTTYTMYFNKKYMRVGHLFQGSFKAVRITEDPQLQHITRYIHMNPSNYKDWEFSSLDYYINGKTSYWLKSRDIMDIFNGNPKEYEVFLDDYKQTKDEKIDISEQLAGY